MISNNCHSKSLFETRRNLLLTFCLVNIKNEVFAEGQTVDEYNYQFLPKNIFPHDYKLPKCPIDNIQESLFVFEYKELRNNKNIIQINFENNNFIKGFINIIGLSEINDAQEILNIYKLNQDASHIILILKSNFNRVRPHVYRSNIDPIIPVPENSSYPGGHATQAYLTALYLSKKYPAFSEQVFQYAYQVGINREIAGLHYPSDTAAGYLLAKKIFVDLEKKLKEI